MKTTRMFAILVIVAFFLPYVNSYAKPLLQDAEITLQPGEWTTGLIEIPIPQDSNSKTRTLEIKFTVDTDGKTLIGTTFCSHEHQYGTNVLGGAWAYKIKDNTLASGLAIAASASGSTVYYTNITWAGIIKSPTSIEGILAFDGYLASNNEGKEFKWVAQPVQ